MDGSKEYGDFRSKWREMALWLLGIVVMLEIAFTLDEIGIPWATSLRIVTAAICLCFIYRIGLDYPGGALASC
jgi:hypothetical protein